ncbi:MAG: hypothetical protein GX620_06405 [Chloroflexi bacterium]|nr:hypothetical protein [Chloroflexota bacterium]
MVLDAVIATAGSLLAHTVQALQRWQFDTASAAIGALAAILLCAGLFASRRILRSAWQRIQRTTERLSHYLQASVEENYRDLVIERSRSLFVPGHYAGLDALFVEPWVTLPPDYSEPVVEFDRDLSAERTVRLHQALRGHPLLLLVGPPGSGRTTILAFLAMTNAQLSKRGHAPPSEAMYMDRLPLYVWLPAMDWGNCGSTSGVAEPSSADGASRLPQAGLDRLVAAAVQAVGGNNAMLKPCRRYLEAGKSIVLIDGWDELIVEQRQSASIWLRTLIDAASGNVWLTTSTPRGYSPLTDIGFVPLKLAPWTPEQIDVFASLWLRASQTSGEPTPAATRKLLGQLRPAARLGAVPIEHVLRTFVYSANGQVTTTRTGLFDRALELLIWRESEPWLLATGRAALGRLALLAQQTGSTIFTRQTVEESIQAALPSSEESPVRATTITFRALTGRQGVLRSVAGGRFTFSHGLWQAYLAARHMMSTAQAPLENSVQDSRWSETIRFYAEIGDVEPLVRSLSQRRDDIFHSDLLTLGSWVTAAPASAPWRDQALRSLARAYLAAGVPLPVRCHLAQALAQTKARGITYLLKQALESPEPEVRIAAVSGVASLAGESELRLFEIAIQDPDERVVRAAIEALGSLQMDAATRWLQQLLGEAGDNLLPTIARALATCGPEGISVLRGALSSEDPLVRRSAALGLGQAGVRDALETLAQQDTQWIVRSAATAALSEIDRVTAIRGVEPPPRIEQLPWLISWAAERGEGVGGTPELARPVLRRALIEGDATIRIVSAHVLTWVGKPDDTVPLRSLLASSEPAVATAALEALREVADRYSMRMEPTASSRAS